MIRRLVLEDLRQNSVQASLNVLGIGFEVTTMLMLAGTAYKALPHPYAAMIVARTAISIMVWFVLCLSFLYVVINRYSQVRERTHQFAIFKILGVSQVFLLDLLFVETVATAVPGTIAGILLAYVGGWLTGWALPDLFVLRDAYEWWLYAGIISAAGFLLSGFLAAYLATRQDLIKALSYED